MASSGKFETRDINLVEARSHIKVSGNGAVVRSYFKGNQCSIEGIQIDSKGLYCFEKLVYSAFKQAMGDDEVMGLHKGFTDYIAGLVEDFERHPARDWQPEASADRICNFMVSFYDIFRYQWKRHGSSTDELPLSFLNIMRECIDVSYIKLTEEFNALPQDIKDTINKVFFLTNLRIDKWYEKLTTFPAA